MRSDLSPWMVRGMRLALGVLVVYGIVQLGIAAGAFLAVPIAASTEIVLSRLQARATPVAHDSAAVEAAYEAAGDDFQRSLPDAANAQAR